MEEIRWNDLYFYITDTYEAIPKQGSWDYFELAPERGGGWLTFFLRVLLLQGEVEVFRGVGCNFFSEELKQFSMQALIIIS